MKFYFEFWREQIKRNDSFELRKVKNGKIIKKWLCTSIRVKINFMIFQLGYMCSWCCVPLTSHNKTVCATFSSDNAILDHSGWYKLQFHCESFCEANIHSSEWAYASAGLYHILCTYMKCSLASYRVIPCSVCHCYFVEYFSFPSYRLRVCGDAEDVLNVNVQISYHWQFNITRID